MTAKGLQDATQVINADARGYIEEFDRIGKKNDEITRSLQGVKTELDSLKRFIDDFERGMGGRNLPFFDMSKVEKQLEQFDALKKSVSDVSEEVWDQAIAHDNLISKYANLGDAARKVTFEQEDMVASMNRLTSEAAESADTIEVLAKGHETLHSANQKLLYSVPAVHKNVQALNDELERGARLARSYEVGLGSSAPITVGKEGYGAYTFGASDQGTGMVAARALRTIEDSNRFMSILPGLLAGGGVGALGGLFAMGRGGGGGGGLGAIAGGIGGGIGDIGGAIAGMSGAGPSAADTSRVVTGFIRRWYPAAHWAMMLTNELLATVGPAVAAGGMGALTGVQGFEQLIPRGLATFNASESLGDSLGTTTGKAWGLKTSYLQNAQDLATGMATELAGAAVNIIGSPKTGDAFTQLGLNTDAMVARFAATLTSRFQKGGLGGQLGNLVTGGTGYLQQFGDTLANLGDTFLNVAPNLPGVGGDLLGVLSGGTGALAKTTGWLGGMLGPILAGEAGMRWGPAILGTAGRSITGVGNLLGNIGRGGILSDIGIGTGTEGGLAGLGAAIGGLSAPEVGGIAAAAFTLSKGYTYQTPEQQLMGRLQQQTGQMGFAAGFPSLISSMQQAAGVSPSDNQTKGWLQNIGEGFGGIFGGIGRLKPSEIWHGITQEVHGGWQAFGGKAPDPGNFTVAQQALQQFAQTAVNALDSGAQIQDQWKGLSGQAIDMGKATDIATMAQLQLGSAFQKNGKLSDQAKQMISNLYAGYAPMHMNTGMFGAAVGAQTAMSGLQHTQIAAVNSAYDQLSQLVTGGGATSSTFFGMLGGTPTTFRRGGIQFAQAPAASAMSKALQSFVTPTGAAAWNTLTNTQTGMFPALQNQLDWLRQAQVMSALSSGQTTGMASFEMAQMLPMLKGSPAGLAMLSTYAQQFGGPGFAPGTSASTMFKSLSSFFGKTGVGAGGYNKLMTLGTEGMANIGTDANQFVQNLGQGIGGAMSTAVFSRGEDLMKAFMGVAGHKGTAAALGNLGNFMFGAGTPLSGAQAMVKIAAQESGASPQSINAMMGQLKKEYDVYVKTHADTSGARQADAAIKMVHDKAVTIKASDQASTAAHQAANAVNSVISKHVHLDASTNAPAVAASARSAMNSVPNVTRTITIIERVLSLPGFTSTGAAQQAAAAAGKMAAISRQTGGLVPGSGFGDIVPAMLEPGEVVVPRNLVPFVAPILAAHRVPGFGMPQSSSSHFAAGGIVPAGASLTQINDLIKNVWVALDKLYSEKDSGNKSVASQIASIWKTELDPLYSARDKLKGGTSSSSPSPATTAAAKNFAITLSGEIAKEVKNSSAAKTIATALVNKIGQEIQYAKSVASSVTSGLNLGGMDLTQGSVLQQMQSYAASSASFGTDLSKLRKGHLNKDLISQIVGAGPVQGDLLAQSILGSGIGGINKVWGQIGASSKVIGSQAAMAQYGGFLAPNLKSGSFSSTNVNISINAGGGATLSLSTAQINALVAKIQAALLKQAKRNPKTGLQLSGKGA